MRHADKVNHLGRNASHRRSLLMNMAQSLILHKRISTTLAKAKVLRRFIEPLLTKSKTDTTHSRRIVFSVLQNKFVVKELFGQIAPAIMERPGGYTRILKLGPRRGDNAEMALIELVDFNEYITEKMSKRGRTRRGRRKKGQKETSAINTATRNIETNTSTNAAETANSETAAGNSENN